MNEQLGMFSNKVGTSIHKRQAMHRNEILCRFLAGYVATYIAAEHIVMTFIALRICLYR